MEGPLKEKLTKILLDAKITPIILTLTFLAILLVLFRMKRVEQDYQYFELTKKLEKLQGANKELRASKFELLSIERLTKLAKDFNLQRPKEEQIIIVP